MYCFHPPPFFFVFLFNYLNLVYFVKNVSILFQYVRTYDDSPA